MLLQLQHANLKRDLHSTTDLGINDAPSLPAQLPDLLVRMGDHGLEEGVHLGCTASQLLPTVHSLEGDLANLD